MLYSTLLVAFLLLSNSYPSIQYANQVFSDKFRRQSLWLLYTYAHTCVLISAHVCALVHMYKYMCILCMFCVFTEKSRKQAGCLRELEWMCKPLVSRGSDTPARSMTELRLECHFYRNGDLWQTGLNKSHVVCVSPSVTAHRQFSIHLGWGTLGGI